MHVVIYTRPECKFCNNAKSLLNSKGIGFNEQRLGEDFTREFLKENYPNAMTYPVVVVDGFHIGGYEELKKLLESNQDNRKYLVE